MNSCWTVTKYIKLKLKIRFSVKSHLARSLPKKGLINYNNVVCWQLFLINDNNVVCWQLCPKRKYAGSRYHNYSRHIKFCKQNTAMLIVLRENKLTLQDINTTPKELKTERDCSHRQLFRPLWSSSAWRNNQRSGSDEKIFAHSDFSPG